MRDKTIVCLLSLMLVLALFLSGCNAPTEDTVAAPTPALPTAESLPEEPSESAEQPPSGDADMNRVVMLPQYGLTVEIPASWQQHGNEPVWRPRDDELACVGVNWVDLQPPQEAEPALLPQGAQILESEAVELTWAQGRSFTLEVYADDASDGDDRAKVATVEQHLIVVVERESGRRAYDVYAVADSPEQLADIMPVYHQLLMSFSLN
jgi:hypothetical protein